MSEKDAGRTNTENFIEFALDNSAGVSSSVKTEERIDAHALAVPAQTDSVEENRSPVFRELAAPNLPELPKRNRARLQMQSPNRLFFYWTLQNNPFQMLNQAFAAQPGSYTLVLKLVDLHSGWESIHPAESEGSRWFDVEANREYRAEIGFYAPNRPYVRAVYSNTVATPRKSPSPRTAESADWAVSSDVFARVLQAAGFERDAFDVELAGDDWQSSEDSARSAFSRFVGRTDKKLSGFGGEELRFALVALASGATLEDLRWRISPALFMILQERSENLDIDRALNIVQEEFGIDADEIIEEEQSAAVFGSSLVNFPRKLRKRRTLPEYSPLSSYSIAR